MPNDPNDFEVSHLKVKASPGQKIQVCIRHGDGRKVLEVELIAPILIVATHPVVKGQQ